MGNQESTDLEVQVNFHDDKDGRGNVTRTVILKHNAPADAQAFWVVQHGTRTGAPMHLPHLPERDAADLFLAQVREAATEESKAENSRSIRIILWRNQDFWNKIQTWDEPDLPKMADEAIANIAALCKEHAAETAVMLLTAIETRVF